MNWKIKAYVTDSGHSDVLKTYEDGTDDLQAGLDVELSYLVVRPRTEWRRPHVAKLAKNVDYKDFYEIRFFADRVQQRPIGFFGPNADDFTIVLWATEKGDKLIPKAWNAISNSRRTEIENNTALAVELDFGE
jgi:hypothetical protein